MSVVTPIQPDATSQNAADYKDAIDATTSWLMNRFGGFAVHQRTDVAPNMTVRVTAGRILTGTIAAGTAAVSTIAAQNSGTITAPGANPRYTLIYITPAGVVGTLNGTEAASPTIPAIQAGMTPLAAVLLQTTSLAITNAMITDLYLPWITGGYGLASRLEMTGDGII